jgi:hypothetical protein
MVAIGLVAAPEDAGGGNATLTGMNARDEGGLDGFPCDAYNHL